MTDEQRETYLSENRVMTNKRYSNKILRGYVFVELTLDTDLIFDLLARRALVPDLPSK